MIPSSRCGRGGARRCRCPSARSRSRGSARADLMVGEVAKRDAEPRGRWLVLLVHRAPGDQLVPDRLAPFASLREHRVRIEAVLAQLALDLVQLLVGRDRQRRALVARVECLHEVAPRVHIAAALDELLLGEARVEESRGIGDRRALAQIEHIVGAELAGALRRRLARRHVEVCRDHIARLNAYSTRPSARSASRSARIRGLSR
jgi:hypothetical protein